MSEPPPQMAEEPRYHTPGPGAEGHGRRIAVLASEGKGPPIVWLGGFRSDMRATKAEAISTFARGAGRACVRFDYGGHGESEGRFEDLTISDWLDDTLAVLKGCVPGRPILVGSSMGAWLALLATRNLRETAPERAPLGLVLIAPAIDFTEALMWQAFPENVRRMIMEDGAWLRPTPYDPEPYPITRRLIEDGRRHLLLEYPPLDGEAPSPIMPGCPVHILQGMQDPDVPWQHAMTLVEHLPGDAVTLTLVKDGDHRLSRPQDIERIIAAIEGIA